MEEKKCKMCGVNLVGHQTSWCSKKCSKRFFRKQWRKRYPEKYKEECRRYRQKWNRYHLKKVLKKKKITLGKECRRCGKTEDLTINHIKPVCIGGSNDPSNIETLCRTCNITEYHSLVRIALKYYFEENR